MADPIDIIVSLRGARAFSGAAKEVSSSVDRMGASVDRSGASAGRAERSHHRFTSALGMVARSARIGATAITGAGVAAGVMGIKYNASMEQNVVAFAGFLGSQKKANAYLTDLQKIAAKTPFEFPELVGGARKLLAFGMTAKDTRKQLLTIGDAVSGIGGGSAEIDRMVMAVGQIQAKGKLSTEELLQMAELGIPAFGILKKELNLTGKELEDKLRKGSISAGVGIAALNKGMNATFAGSSAKQAKTFTGQISTMKDTFTAFAGEATKPLFEWTRTTGLPVVNDALTKIAKNFKTAGIMGIAIALDDLAGGGYALENAWGKVLAFDFSSMWKSAKTTFAGLKTSFESIDWNKLGSNVKSASGPLESVFDVLKKLAGNANVQKFAAVLVGAAVAFKAVDKASGGAAGASLKFAHTSALGIIAVINLVTGLVGLKAAHLTHAASANASAVAESRSRIAIIASGIAAKVSAVGTFLLAAATRAWTLAMSLNPIGLIVIGLIALGAAIYLAYRKSETFRNIIHAVWGAIKSAAAWVGGAAVVAFKAFWAVLKNTPLGMVLRHLRQIVTFVRGMGSAIATAAVGMWDGIKTAFRAVINFIIGGWNSLDFAIPGFDPPGPGPKLEGFNLGVPDIPMLAKGGSILRGGAAIVGEKGPELVSLPRAATVAPMERDRSPGFAAPAPVEPRNQPIQLVVDGRVLAEVVARTAASARARR